ncbi:MarR family transcriptional regulator [Lactiplantibacillus pentosus]|jgi:transcriptional regulator with XRE-family HTH domain|uniref:MarR family transcriptional regulator n=1 Tax=Lactobacillaceae TaxID=33958 RepID=UPI001C1F0C09|nr:MULTISPECIES: helix-turn-helix domain-containing protein [Lactobacillaceae]MBU7488578.1 MarR family transcriptional regulator [Lactiplantibacillus pentosus]MBU7501724.1 MarR family transcriptional regulator [Lactiplantibacillus pentosus]MBU7504935.1 MarR family transcriptional regulator [Lactiplantibacillus pentosus]MBU7508164.1 MarR family transcriptional regulator [Lactiplantibacillus pentosus]MBU7511405.1 MarR family transcriptional regulator [Lactiplantibacillus pentosus]
MPKTIRELADELGVSKQRIQQIIAKLSPSKTPNKEGNRYVLNAQDVKNIKALMGFENNKSSTSESTNRLVDYDVYLDVIDSIKEKDEQIKSLLEVQKQTQNLLDQQQRLALQDKNLLEEYKIENDSLKALKMPSQETETKQLDNQPKDELKALKEQLETLQEQKNARKWWNLWRK